MYRIVHAVVLLVVLAAPAQGGWDEGWDAYKRLDHAMATREFMALAERGDVRAQVTLQIMEVFDEGGPRDPYELEKWRNAPNKQNRIKALRWFRNAADQGDTKAWTLLGSMYDDIVVRFFHGELTVRQDRDKAVKWYRKAAERGEVTAQKILSYLSSIQSKTTESDYWLRKAAEQGDRWAYTRLAKIYMDGPQRDDLRAYMWLDLSAAQGVRGAARERDKVAKKLRDLGKIDEAKQLVQVWKDKHQSGEAQTAAVAPPESGEVQTAAVAPPESGEVQTAAVAPPESGEAQTVVEAPPESGEAQTTVVAPPESGEVQTAAVAPPGSGENQTAAVVPPPEAEGDGTPSCLAGAKFGPITEDSPWFGQVEGVQVVDVEPGSSASQMGLHKHDFIVEINDQQVRDLDEFGAAMRKLGDSSLWLGLRPSDGGNDHLVAC